MDLSKHIADERSRILNRLWGMVETYDSYTYLVGQWRQLNSLESYLKDKKQQVEDLENGLDRDTRPERGSAGEGDFLEETDTKPEQASERVDALAKLAPNYLGDAAKWFVLVRPYRHPAIRESGLAEAESTQKAKQVFNYVGQILSLGDLCNQAVTTSGLDFKKSRKWEVGDWAIYQPHSGFEVATDEVYVDELGNKQYDILRILKETDLMFHVRDPSKLWSWLPNR